MATRNMSVLQSIPQVLKSSSSRFLFVLLSLIYVHSRCADSLAETTHVTGAVATNFKVFDATLYTGKPDLTKFGLHTVALIYEASLWGSGVKGEELPEAYQVTKAAQEVNSKNQLCVLDIERWLLKGSPSTIAMNLQKYETVLDWFRRSAPNKIIGYYGLPVGRDYWRAIDGKDSAKYKNWQAENDIFKRIATKLDVSFPSLYAFYADSPAWVTYAVANIQESRRVNPGRPVYAFLMPRFHESNKILGNKDIPGSFWKLQLDTVRKYADGVVIWGGYKQQWDEDAEWWQVTKEYVRTLK